MKLLNSMESTNSSLSQATSHLLGSCTKQIRTLLLVTATVAGSAVFGTPAFGQTSDLLFDTPLAFDVADFGQCMSSSDLDGDGNLDIIVGHWYGISILWGDGEGQFETQVLGENAGGPMWLPLVTGVCASDLDSDGDLDIAFTYNVNLGLLRNEGNRTFQVGSAATYYNQDPVAVVAAKLDGDQFPDLIVAVRDRDSLSVVMNLGGFQFANPTTYKVGSKPNKLTVADFNRDSYLDVAVANSGASTISLRFNDGLGNLTNSSLVTSQLGASSLVTADFDADGDMDLAEVADSTHNLLIFSNDGSGGFVLTSSYGQSSYAKGLAAGDNDLDGDVDLIIGGGWWSQSYGWTYFRAILSNSGIGTFAEVASYGTGAVIDEFLIDVNNDGWLDCVWLGMGDGWQSAVFRSLNRGDGTFQDVVRQPSQPFQSAILSLDANSDGKTDVMTVGAYYFSIHYNLGNGTFSDGTAFNRATRGAVQNGVISGDFNIDGYLDIGSISTSYGKFLSINYGNGLGSFGTGVQYYIPDSSSAMNCGDFDQNGRVDIVVTNRTTGAVSVLWNDLPSPFSNFTIFSVGTNPSIVAVGDLNGDGRHDIVCGNSQSRDISVLLNAGQQNFAPHATYALPLHPYGLAVGDVNADHLLDVVVCGYDTTSNNVQIMAGLGGGALAAPVGISCGAGYTQVLLSDLNADGASDIIVPNGAGYAGVRLNNGAGTFGPTIRYAVPGRTLGLSTADYDGNHSNDVAASLYDGASFAVLLAAPPGVVDSAPDLSVSNSGIAFVPATPHIGQGVDVRVIIRNRGFGVAHNITVEFATDASFTQLIGNSQVIDLLAGGDEVNLTAAWSASASVDTIYVRVDPDNSIPELSEANNSARSPIDVISLDGISIVINPLSQIAELQDTICYGVTVVNSTTDDHSVALSCMSLEQVAHQFDRDTLVILPGERKNATLTVMTGVCSGITGVFDYQVGVQAIDNPALSSIGSATLTVTSTPVFSDILPADGQTLASNSVTFMWHTRTPSTSTVYFRKTADATFRLANGASGTEHSVVLTDLDFDAEYLWYAKSTSNCGTDSSEIQRFRTGKGVVFTDHNYAFTIRRAYNQTASVQVRNLDSVAHEVLVEVLNPHPDLIAGFTEEGSIDEMLTLAPGQNTTIALALHGQDAMDTTYRLAFRVTSTASDSSTAYDYAQAWVTIDWPDTNFSLIDLGLNQQTLVRTMRLQNSGDTITDFAVSVSEAVGIDYLMVPQIEHAMLAPGEQLDFQLIPTFEDTVSFKRARASCRAKLTVTGAGKAMSYDLTDCCSKEIFYVQKSDVLLCSEITSKSWYCTNRPHIGLNVQAPRVGSGTVTKAILTMSFDPWSSVRPHTVKVYVNGHLVHTFSNTIPVGEYSVEVDPQFLVYSSSGPSNNRVELITSHMNGGHYLVATNISLCLCLSTYSEYVCADNEADAQGIVESRPYLFTGKPTSVTVTSPTPGTVPKWTGTMLTANVQPPHRKYDVTADISYTGGGSQAVNLQWNSSQQTYSANWLPQNCSDATINVTAGVCGNAAAAPVAVSVVNCDQPNIDLAIKQLYFTSVSQSWAPNFSADYPKADRQFIGAVVTNNGTTTATNVEVDFRVEGQSIGISLIPSVAAEQIVLVDKAWQLQNRVTEDADIEVITDPAYQIPESNRDNDRMSESVNIYYATDPAGRPFDFHSDAYSFRNWAMTYEDFSTLLNTFSNSECPGSIDEALIRLATPFWWALSELGGHCFGMSNTTSLYLSNGISYPGGKTHTYDLTQTEGSPLIREYQLYQLFYMPLIYPPVPGGRDEPYQSLTKLRTLLRDKNELPVLVFHQALNPLSEPVLGQGAHAINAYKLIETGSGLSAVSLYDNNADLRAGVAILPQVGIFTGSDNNIEFNARHTEKASFENLDYNEYLSSPQYFLSGVFPYCARAKTYKSVLVMGPHDKDCRSISDNLKDLFNYVSNKAGEIRKRLITQFGKAKSYIRDKLGRRSGFVPLVARSATNLLPTQYMFVNEIPGCDVDTSSSSMIFQWSDSVDVDLFISSTSDDTLTFSYVSRTFDDGRRLRLVQFAGIAQAGNWCAEATLSDSSDALVVRVQAACGSGVIDTLQPTVVRVYQYGDLDTDGNIDISDLTALIDYLYISFIPPYPIASADLDCSGNSDITDLSTMIDYLYISFTPIPGCQ